MDTKQICPGCQKLLAPNAPQGLCPECLIKAGLGTGVEIGPDSQAEGGQVRFVAPTPEELVKPFPQLEILSFIGQGGMGAVYKARQKSLDRVVALKILPPGIGKDPSFAQRFTREAKALAKLNHPGIVTLYEFGQADGLFYFLMEFVDGVNLRHLLAAGRLSPREALAIVPQICDALQYAHDQGIVHRDIKPENILLDRQGRVKVADFGLAKLVSAEAEPSAVGGVVASSAVLTEAGKVMGTPQYMAPEQREAPATVDHRADIYSLGVVLYQMLTGELPGKPMEPPSHTVRVDVRLDEVVLRALAKEPERRYQQVSQMKSAVETITTNPPGTQPPAGETVALPGATGMESIRRDVKGPAIGLVVTAILNWILIPVAFLVLAYWHAGLEDVPGSRPFLPIPLLAITPLVLCSFIIYAALKMMRLEARGAALAASVLAIIVTPGNIIGLPFGIWALVVLNRREVRAAFAGDKAALASVLSAPARSPAAWPWIVAAVGMVAVVMFLLIPVAIITVPAVLARRSHLAEAVRHTQQAAEQARSAVVQSQSRARLSQGEIELVGISFHPSTNQPWWRPDGSPCPEGPFELRSSTSSATGESMTREFVIRLTGLPADASGPVWKLDRGSWAGSSVQVRGQPVPDLQGISATVPKSARTMTIKVGVGMGAWETVANQVPGGSGITGVSHQGSNWVVSFPKAEGGPGGARILVTHTVRDWETRVLAVDKDGQEHLAPSSESSGTDAFTQIIAKFPELPLERVKEFQFQVRSYQWVEFRDGALYPKQPPSGSSASWPRGFRAKADVSVPSIADVPEIESVVLSRDQAIIKQRRFDGEGMIFTFGTMTNRWAPGSVYFDHMFDVTLEWPWFGHGANWVVKTRHGIYASYRLDGPPGPMLGKIVFHPGTPAAETDGSYVIGEFKPETGVALPIAVRLVRDGKPSASPATAKTWSPALAAGEKPDLQKIRNEADSLMNQGRYEEALQRHIWYFNHALENGEVNPVRLSFGLTGWGELARRYPQARQALIQVRDRDAQMFSTGGGSFDLFQEAANINRELRDDDATVALFKNIQTDPALARRCYFVAEDLLVRKGEYALCSNYIGDPQPRFQTICTSRDMEKKIDPAGKADNRFVVSTRQLIEILISAGRKTEAEKIRDEAVSLLDDARLKSAVSDAEEKVRQMLRQGETNKKLPAQPQSAPNAPMPSPAAPPAAQKLSFGPVTNGLQAAVELTASNGVVRLGEPIAVRFHIRNASDHPIIVAGSAYRQGDQCILEDEQGHRVEVSLSEREIITFTQRLLLGLGEVMVFESGGLSFQSGNEAKFSYLASHIAKARPGRYTLRFRLHLPDAGPPDKPGPGDWQGDLETAPIVLDVNDPAPPAPAAKPATK